jgi:hypothetical protein
LAAPHGVLQPPTHDERLNGDFDDGCTMIGFFRPELERALVVIAGAALVAAIVLPVGWGYEQRQQARAWQEVACAYRLKEVGRGMTLLTSSERRAPACALLRQLGFDIEPTP